MSDRVNQKATKQATKVRAEEFFGGRKDEIYKFGGQIVGEPVKRVIHYTTLLFDRVNKFISMLYAEYADTKLSIKGLGLVQHRYQGYPCPEVRISTVLRNVVSQHVHPDIAYKQEPSSKRALKAIRS